MTMKLSSHQQAIIDVLGVNGGWMEQEEIAHQLGKDILSPEDAQQLDLLEDAGFVVKEISDATSPQGQKVRYRFAEPKVEIKNHGSS
jgi:hypothetical protein